MSQSRQWVPEAIMAAAISSAPEYGISLAADADRRFSILMGDDVEPRREFIEKNAKYVRNLDV
jgi:DNA gyrase/topoisomerase IV subunit B